jgi:hypothetical protein
MENVKHWKPVALGKILLVYGVIFGFILGFLVLLASIFYTGDRSALPISLTLGYGITSLFVMPLIYGLAGFLFGWICSPLFKFAVKLTRVKIALEKNI